ncbi:hypothetical protein AB3S75_013080 [Citrus x aurantiifolia]
MGLPTLSSTPPSEREGVIVVMDANRNKSNVDALEWALKNVVRPRDAVVVLGVLYDIGRKNFSCFPLNRGISISGIWERLEFSSGQGEVNPRELGEEIEKKREQYQITLQPFHRQCKKNEVKLEVKLAAGYSPARVTVKEAQNSNTRWIVLDSHLKKHKVYIYGHVGCNVAVMKGKNFATLMPSNAPRTEHSVYQNPKTRTEIINIGVSSNNESQNPNYFTLQENQPSSASAPTPPSPCWFPLSWRTGYPRAFTLNEVEEITNELSDEHMIEYIDDRKIYHGIFQEIPVIISSFSENDERFWSMLMILSRVRHCNIVNLVGYCCSGANRFLLTDYPCMATLEINLKVDDTARKLSWKARWYIAQEIGGSLRYLHEECGDEPIVHQSVCSSNVVISHCCSAMLTNFITAKLLNEESTEYHNAEEDELLSVDVHDYGILLVELITGRSASFFTNHGEGQSFLDWALPILEDGPISQAMDPRLMNSDDSWVVQCMAKAALLCLKNDDSGHRYSISEVLAVVRGDQLAISRC